MDLLTIWQTLWRRRWVALPLVLLTVAAAGWAVVLRPPVYESSATLLLLQPPAPPTAAQLERDPDLAKINADNPYTRVYDPAVLIAVVAEIVQSDPMRRRLVAAGADERYLVTNSVRYGLSSPLVEISSTADTPQRATATTRLVAAAFTQQLRELQAKERVNPRYFVLARDVGGPPEARLRAADKMRALVGVLGLGAIGMFSAISIADALGKLRAQRRSRRGSRPGRRRHARGRAGTRGPLPDRFVPNAAGSTNGVAPAGTGPQPAAEPRG